MRGGPLRSPAILLAAGALALALMFWTGGAPSTAPALAQSATPGPKPALSPSKPDGAANPSGLPAPPAVSGGVYANNLTDDAVFATGVCPSKRALGENVGEGFKLTVRGKCLPDFTTADVAVFAKKLNIWDGDIALDFKVVVGKERAAVALYGRYLDRTGIVAKASFASNEIEIYTREEGNNTTLTSRADLSSLVSASEWQRLAMRFSGTDVWVLLNDQPILHAADVMDQDGAVGLQVLRDGDIEDEDEVTVVFRDLTLSAVDGSPEERAPFREED
jgi:hypothetical protein